VMFRSGYCRTVKKIAYSKWLVPVVPMYHKVMCSCCHSVCRTVNNGFKTSSEPSSDGEVDDEYTVYEYPGLATVCTSCIRCY